MIPIDPAKAVKIVLPFFVNKLLKLKMLGQCDSLNVGVATSVLLYDIKMKQLGE